MSTRRVKRSRVYLLALVAQYDPNRYRDRTVQPECGKGRKDRPRSKRVDSELW